MLKAMSEKGEAELQDEKVQYAKRDMGARGVSFLPVDLWWSMMIYVAYVAYVLRCSMTNVI